MPRVSRFVLLVVVSVGILLPAAGRAAEPKDRPDSWATKLDRPGLPNLHIVDDGLYRGAQPTARGMRELEKLGVKTIVNLRSNHSDEQIVAGSNLTLANIPMNTWAVRDKDIVRFLRVATNEDFRPVFVHCQHGADRTGTMCAAYRLVVEDWTKRQAVDEMTEGDFGFHSIWRNLPKLIERLNVQEIREKVDLEKP